MRKGLKYRQSERSRNGNNERDNINTVVVRFSWQLNVINQLTSSSKL